MKILGIDTTTKFLALGIYDNTRICEYNLDLDKQHSSLLIITIKRILDALGWQFKDIDYFACGLGPGSFTGIRVGLATIKGLAWSLNKPVVGISTLDILARNVDTNDRPIVPMIDAKRNLIYCSIYKTKNGRQKRIAPYMLLTEDEFFRKVKPKAIVFADAVDLYKENILRNIKGANILDKDYWYPRGRNIINLAWERIKEKRFSNPFDIRPVYLYPKECQIRK
jgi:tRNA threonylcarbamoyladenosine biosynthesis protein TsaB